MATCTDDIGSNVEIIMYYTLQRYQPPLEKIREIHWILEKFGQNYREREYDIGVQVLMRYLYSTHMSHQLQLVRHLCTDMRIHYLYIENTSLPDNNNNFTRK